MSRFGQANKTIQISGKIFGETLKAIRFHVEKVGETDISLDNQKTLWFPLSQIPKMLRQPPSAQEQDILHVNEWLWKQKVQDDWKGKDPAQEDLTAVDLEQALAEDPSDYDDIIDEEEGPPF